LFCGAPLNMPGAQAFTHRLRRDNAIRVRHNLVIGLGDFIMQPTLHGSIPFLQGAQTSAYDFTCRAISACFHKAIYE